MDAVLRDLLDASGGVVTRAQALEVVPPWTLRSGYRNGLLRRVLPAVYVDGRMLPSTLPPIPLAAVPPGVARRAVLAYADGWREVDLRRDALLATVGILVVRFAHRRLLREPDEVRRETLAILASRRP